MRRAGRRPACPTPSTFRTKPQLARAMLERALAAGVPAAWVTGDEVYGGDRRLRLWLEEQDVPHVLAVKRTEPLWADHHAGPRAGARPRRWPMQVPAADWQRLSAGAGAKGPRALRLGAGGDSAAAGARAREYWLLVRRSLSRPDRPGLLRLLRPGGHAARETLVRVAGTRWAIEESFESAKGEVGLDQYEVRRWPGWYRHITLALLAQAYLTVTRAAAVKKGAAKRPTSCR